MIFFFISRPAPFLQSYFYKNVEKKWGGGGLSNIFGLKYTFTSTFSHKREIERKWFSSQNSKTFFLFLAKSLSERIPSHNSAFKIVSLWFAFVHLQAQYWIGERSILGGVAKLPLSKWSNTFWWLSIGVEKLFYIFVGSGKTIHCFLLFWVSYF